MAQQRQPFRFRLPWLAAPQQAPAAPRPSQITQTQTLQEPATPRPSKGAQPPSQSASRPSQGAQPPATPQPSQAAQGPSQTAPAAPRPSEMTQAASQQPGSLAQRAPFHPAGVAPTQPTPSARAEPPSTSTPTSLSSQGMPQIASRPRETQPPQGPTASPSRKLSQIPVTSQPASPSQANSKVQQAKKASPQLPSSSHGGTQTTKPKTTTATPPTLPQANYTSPTKKLLTITTEVSQNKKEPKKRETSKLPSEEGKPMPKTAAPHDKVVDDLGGPKKQPSFEEPKVKASTKSTTQVFVFNSSVIERNPGVHTVHYRNPVEQYHQRLHEIL